MSRIACVVGARSAIGSAIAARLAGEGFHVVGVGRTNPDTSALAEFVQCDVTSDGDVERAAGEILRIGVPEVVVYAAGSAAMGHTLEVPLGAAREAFEVNFWGVVRVLRGLLPPMRAAGRGTVVVVLSLAAVRAIPFEAYYAASKAAAARWLETLAFEARNDGVMVKRLSPGFVDTGFLDRVAWYGMSKPPVRGSGLTTEDVAEEAVCLIRSRRSSCIPGWRERTIVLLDRFAPGFYDRLLQARARR